MKKIVCALILAFFLLSAAMPRLTTAQTAGSSATGRYWFALEDGFAKYVEFDARTDDQGVSAGYMTFTDDAKMTGQDVDGSGEGVSEGPSPFYVKVEFDGLTVEKNRALMSGIVRDSSHRDYIGKWAQLVVEDNGDNLKMPDRLVWRLCQPEPGGWIPSDAEVPGDDGAWLRWWATDAERRDDVGIPSKNLIPGERKGCEVFPLRSYAFADLRRWEGNIQVLP